MRGLFLAPLIAMAVAVPSGADEVQLPPELSQIDQLWLHEQMILQLDNYTEVYGITVDQLENAAMALLISASRLAAICGVNLPPYEKPPSRAMGLQEILGSPTRYSSLTDTYVGPCLNPEPSFDERITDLSTEGSAFLDQFGTPGVLELGPAVPEADLYVGAVQFNHIAMAYESLDNWGGEWVELLLSAAEDDINNIRENRLALAIAEENQEEIVWAMAELAELEYLRQFLHETRQFWEAGKALTPETPERDDLIEIDGCWFAYDGLIELEVDVEFVFARDAFDGFWVGTVGSDGLTLTQSFRDIGAYRRVAERLAGGEISAELDAIVATLFGAGVQQQISIYLPDDLTGIQTLEVEYRETLVAEPVVGAASPQYEAVSPEDAVHGAIWQFPSVWAQVPTC